MLELKRTGIALDEKELMKSSLTRTRLRRLNSSNGQYITKLLRDSRVDSSPISTRRETQQKVSRINKSGSEGWRVMKKSNGAYELSKKFLKTLCFPGILLIFPAGPL